MDGNNFSYNGYGGQPGTGQIAPKRPNILEQFAYSFQPQRYGDLARVKTGGMIGFVTLLALASTVCIFLLFVFTYISRGGADSFWDWVPDFELRDGRLSMDEEYVLDRRHQYVYITDETYGFRKRDVEHMAEQGYKQIILAGSERICVLSYDKYTEYAYSDLGDDLEIDREWVIAHLAPIFWVVTIIGFVVFFVGRTFWYFFCAMIYWLCALLMAAMLHKKIRTGVLYKAAVYSKVPMLVFATVLSFSIPGILRVAITLIFLGTAVGKLPEAAAE